MVFKLKRNNWIFWTFFGVGFGLIFGLAIGFDYQISEYIYNNNINKTTSKLNEVFSVYGTYIITVPIYVAIICILKYWVSVQKTTFAWTVAFTIFYDIVFIVVTLLLTFFKVWQTQYQQGFWTELITSIMMLFITIFTIIFTNLVLFTKKILKTEIDVNNLLEKALYCITFVVLSALTTWLLKVIVGRPRPFQVFQEGYNFKYAFEINFSSQRGNSFPSGHTMGSISSFGLMFFARKDTKKRELLFRTFQLIIGITATITAISRIFYLKHFLSDVLMATLICSLYVIFTKSIVKKVFYRQKKISIKEEG